MGPIIFIYLIITVSSESIDVFKYLDSQHECSRIDFCGAMGRQPCNTEASCGPCINGFVPFSDDSRICRRIKPGDSIMSTDILADDVVVGAESKRAHAAPQASYLTFKNIDGQAAANRHTMTFIILFAFTIAGTLLVVVLGVAYHKYSKREINKKSPSEIQYGIAGNDDSEEKELARKTQIYHYQHQKRIISAMEHQKRGGDDKVANAVDSSKSPCSPSESRNEGQSSGILSKLKKQTSTSSKSSAPPPAEHHATGDDSEEECDPDLTVYECPGLAPSGEMEVKNPLFSNDEDATDEEEE